MRIQGANFPLSRLNSRASPLDSSHLALDAQLDAFARQATDPSNLLLLSAAGLSYQMGKTATLVAFSNSSLRLIPRVLAPLVGLNMEVASLHAAHRLGAGNIPTESSAEYRSYLSTLLDVGVLKGIGSSSHSLTSPVRHLMQSAGMVASHRLASAMRLIPENSSSNLFRELLDAEATNIAMESGSLAFQFVTGGRIHLLERSLAAQGRMLEALPVESAREPLQSFAAHELASREVYLRSSTVAEYFSARRWKFWENAYRVFRVWRFERALASRSETERITPVRSLSEAFNSTIISSSQEAYLQDALIRSFRHLKPGQVREISDLSLKYLEECQGNPVLRKRWIPVLKASFQRLDPPQRERTLGYMREAAFSSLPELARVAEESLRYALNRLSREEMEVFARSMQSLDFQPVNAMESVEKIFEVVFDRLENLRSDERRQEDIRREAAILGSYLGHPVYELSVLAEGRFLRLLSSMDENEGLRVLNNLEGDISDNFSTRLRAVEDSVRPARDVASSISWLRAWQIHRTERVLESIREDLRSLSIPSEWRELAAAVKNINGMDALTNVVGLFRARFSSEDPAVQQVAEAWFRNSSSSERMRILQILVGSREYWKLNSRAALRLRNWVLYGIQGEVGIAAKNPVIQDKDDVVFVLGNHTSVSMSLGFVRDYSREEALRYIMVHHTHPEMGGDDINQIYPSTFVEGCGSGDLHALRETFMKLGVSELALSQLHGKGGSIFVMKDNSGNLELNIYTGIRDGASDLGIHPLLQRVRERIRRYGETSDVRVNFFEMPFDRILRMDDQASHPRRIVQALNSTPIP